MLSELERNHLTHLREGDLSAFKFIYDAYHQRIYGYCLKLCSDSQAAEEITEDVFVRLWIRRSIIDPSLEVAPLLFKITKDFAWNFLKKNSRRKSVYEGVRSLQISRRDPEVESQLALDDYLHIADKAITRLPPRRRKVFVLHYREGMDNKSIAETLNISESTVRVQLLKASQFLRDFMRTHPEMPLSLIFLWMS